jgi:hypothetical protein
MTHDELLDKIYWHWKNSDDSEFHGLSGYRKALRAVVELHNPVEYVKQFSDGETLEGEFICNHCNYDYPCPTIQAIEKELA